MSYILLIVAAIMAAISAMPKISPPDQPLPLIAKEEPKRGLRPLSIPPGYIAVPIKISDSTNHVWIRGLVDGREVNLLVDTGASRTMFSLATARRLGWKTESNGTITNFQGVELAISRAEIRTFQLGKKQRDHFPVLVFDLSKIAEVYANLDGVAFDGLLGADLLNSASAILDYGGKQLLLYDPRSCDEAALQGDWFATKYVSVGQNVEMPVLTKKPRITVDNRAMIFADLIHTTTGTIALSPEFRPSLLTLTEARVDGLQRSAVVWRYRLDGDRLTLQFGVSKRIDAWDDIPEWISTKENGTAVVVFARAKLLRAPQQVIAPPPSEQNPKGVAPDAVRQISDPWLLDIFPFVRLIHGIFPKLGGPYSAAGWSYTLNKDLTITAENDQKTIRMTIRHDRSVAISAGHGANIIVPPGHR